MKNVINSGVSKNRGFTLIELLVVIAIIGLLASLMVVALSVSRMRARDARRVSDMKQVKLGLDLYLNEAGGYPPDVAWVPGAIITCTNAFTRVPNDPFTPNYVYTFAATGSGIPSSCTGSPTVYPGFTIEFYIENKAALYHMNEDGNVFDSLGSSVSWDSLLN